MLEKYKGEQLNLFQGLEILATKKDGRNVVSTMGTPRLGGGGGEIEVVLNDIEWLRKYRPYYIFSQN